MNEDIYFELGWHMLKNRADDKHASSFKERNESERNFFSKGSYNELSRTIVGIESLRGRLSALLNNHLSQELPHLKKELDVKLKDTAKDLEKLGEKRSTVHEQRQFLMQLSIKAHDVLKSAVSGHYEGQFFGLVDTTSRIDSSSNFRRLRAVIQFLNFKFAKDMRQAGHKFQISKPDNSVTTGGASSLQFSDSAEDKATEEPDNDSTADTTSIIEAAAELGTTLPKRLNRDEGLQWVLRVLQRSRGRELPGNVNPSLISQLFWEQSEPWEMLAKAHISAIASVCSRFVQDVLETTASKEVKPRLWTLRIEAAMKASLDAAQEELKKLVQDKGRHPIT